MIILQLNLMRLRRKIDKRIEPHLIKTDDYTIIDDTYNASFDSVKNSLDLLSKVKNRKVFIFADILELDTFGEDIHRDIGKVVIDNEIDVLITVGILSKYTHDVVSKNSNLCYHYENNDLLIKDINKIIKEEDMILIKGSHGMNLIEIVNYLKNKNA